MKLILDNNLSPRLVPLLAADYPGTAHVREFSLQRADDDEIWAFAKERGFVIVSKDEDFHQRSFLYGSPPKVIWVRAGNRSTKEILEILHRSSAAIAAFEVSEDAAFLTVP